MVLLGWLAAGLVLKTSGGAAHDLFVGPVFPIGASAEGVLSGDLNQDGRLDLVVVDSDFVSGGNGTGGISVLMGNGDGTFASRVLIDQDMEPMDAILADPNQDGKLDIVVAAFEPFVLPGNGDGTFGARVIIPVPDSSCVFFSIAKAHFNQDAIMDVVVGCLDPAFNREGFILGGTGDEAFYTAMAPVDVHWLLVPGDFDQDGFTDIVTRTSISSGDLAILRGHGNGTFDAPQVLPYAATNTVVASDFNDDGRLDLAFKISRDEIGVLLGASNGFFEPDLAFQAVTSLDRVDSITVGDFDDNDEEDLFLTHVVTSCHPVFLSNGDGTFGAETCYETLQAGGYGGADVGDFNGDGNVDLAIASLVGSVGFNNEKSSGSSGLVHILPGDGEGGFVPDSLPPEFDVGTAPAAILIDDFDGNGILDVVTANTDSADVSLLFGAAGGGFLPATSVPVGTGPVAIASGTLDGGGTRDLVVAHQGSSDLVILLGSGDGSFAFAPLVPLSGTARDVALDDLDDDGVNDLVVTSGDADSVSILFGNGDGTFVAPVVLAVGSSPHAVAIADLGGEPALDLVVANEISQDASVLFGNGDGSFQPEVRVPAGTSPRLVTVADLDLDGDRDLVLGRAYGRSVFVVRNDGAGGFLDPVAVDVVIPVAKSLAITDINGDRWPDIVVSSHSGSVLTVALGTETGDFEPVSFRVWGDAGVVAAGDLNGDGRVDIAHAGARDSVTVLFNQGPLSVVFGPDAATLTWPLTVGTESYEVYRGALSDLLDSDADGLPDGGYGVCVSLDDPDPGDNVFVDAENPLPGEGFFYLMARVGGPQNDGLGTNSAGQPRLPALPCSSKFREVSLETRSRSSSRGASATRRRSTSISAAARRGSSPGD